MERVLGPEHPDIANSLNNLGPALQTQGNYAEAEALYRRSLAIFERGLGPEHPDTAYSCNNLGMLYATMKQWPEATEYVYRTLQIFLKALGPEHPMTHKAIENMQGVVGGWLEEEPGGGAGVAVGAFRDAGRASRLAVDARGDADWADGSEPQGKAVEPYGKALADCGKCVGAHGKSV